jgi:hypothetical protein
MPNMKVSLNLRYPLGTQVAGLEGLRRIIQHLEGAASGRVPCDSVKYSWNDSVAPQAVGSYAGPACGLVVFASSSGAVGATIGGTLQTVTWATSDILSATAFATAVRANATVGLFVTASNKLAVMTLASVLAGTSVEVWNTKFTAIANGVTPSTVDTFSIGASDTAAALNLVTAINRHPSLSGRICAVSVAGVIYIGMPDDRVVTGVDGIRNPLTSAGAAATTITTSAPIPVANARTMIFANDYGVLGNFVTVVASGTNVSYATNGTAGQLGQGCGGAVPAYTQDVIP